MILSTHEDVLELSTNRELSDFEREFEYPLDSQQNFTISHGEDYLRFFRSMGRVTCFVARSGSSITGVLTTVQRKLYLPGRGVRQAIYLCDLKVSEKAESAMVFFGLVQKAKEYYRAQDLPAYGIVMHGTGRNPAQYTGAFGIPRFETLGEVAILRIPVSGQQQKPAKRRPTKQIYSAFNSLNTDCVHTRSVNSGIGSRYQPAGLLTTNGKACGIVTDTLESKRLHSGAEELISAHLSHYAYERPQDGADIVRSALKLCADRNIPALFLSLPQSRLAEWQEHNHYPLSTLSGATIYGLGLEPGLQWNINTSEV